MARPSQFDDSDRDPRSELGVSLGASVFGSTSVAIVEEGLRLALAATLILMAIQMPGMDGLEAIQRIRQDPKFVDIPIIVLTALAMAGDREKCLAAGVTEYLAKPMSLKQLVTVIQQLLDASEPNA